MQQSTAEHKLSDHTLNGEHFDYETLHKEFGRYKKLPRGYGLQTLIALSKYPELKNVKINFTFMKSGYPLTARPEFLTVFRSPKKRTYQIAISTEINKERDALLLKNLPFN